MSTIIGIAGSPRMGSFNAALLRACAALAAQVLDEQGRLVDPTVKKLAAESMAGFADFIARERRG